jgi:hypothetical protein
MTRRQVIMMVPAGVILALPGTGCKSDSPTNGLPTGPTADQALTDLGSLLKNLAEEKKRPPAKAAEMDQYEPIAMSAARGLAANQIVYVWGARYSPGSKAIVAYEANAESAGGRVLLQDGTVQSMSADELRATPKATK